MTEKDKENMIFETARDETNFIREVELDEKRRAADEIRLSKELEHQSKINALEYAKFISAGYKDVEKYIENARVIYNFLK